VQSITLHTHSIHTRSHIRNSDRLTIALFLRCFFSTSYCFRCALYSCFDCFDPDDGVDTSLDTRDCLSEGLPFPFPSLQVKVESLGNEPVPPGDAIMKKGAEAVGSTSL
jgi:hypothetical protein